MAVVLGKIYSEPQVLALYDAAHDRPCMATKDARVKLKASRSRSFEFMYDTAVTKGLESWADTLHANRLGVALSFPGETSSPG